MVWFEETDIESDHMPFSTVCNHCAFPGCDCMWPILDRTYYFVLSWLRLSLRFRFEAHVPSYVRNTLVSFSLLLCSRARFWSFPILSKSSSSISGIPDVRAWGKEAWTVPLWSCVRCFSICFQETSEFLVLVLVDDWLYIFGVQTLDSNQIFPLPMFIHAAFATNQSIPRSKSAYGRINKPIYDLKIMISVLMFSLSNAFQTSFCPPLWLWICFYLL